MNNNENSKTIFSDDDFTVIAYFFSPSDYSRRAKTRVYVNGEEDVDFSEAYDLQKANGYQARGVNEAEDKLFSKLNRQVVKNKKAVIEDVLQASEEVDSILVHGGKLTFSRIAGCGCGCSPAFVPQNMMSLDGRYIQSIGITKKAA